MGGQRVNAAQPYVRVFSVQVLCPSGAVPKNSATPGNFRKNSEHRGK